MFTSPTLEMNCAKGDVDACVCLLPVALALLRWPPSIHGSLQPLWAALSLTLSTWLLHSEGASRSFCTPVQYVHLSEDDSGCLLQLLGPPAGPG